MRDTHLFAPQAGRAAVLCKFTVGRETGQLTGPGCRERLRAAGGSDRGRQRSRGAVAAAASGVARPGRLPCARSDAADTAAGRELCPAEAAAQRSAAWRLQLGARAPPAGPRRQLRPGTRCTQARLLPSPSAHSVPSGRGRLSLIKSLRRKASLRGVFYLLL